VLPTELRPHGYEEGRRRGADGQPFVSAGGIERLGVPGRVHTDLRVACRPFDLRLDLSNQPGSNPAALEAGADVQVPEVAARPTSRAYKSPVALSDEQPSVGVHALKASHLDPYGEAAAAVDEPETDLDATTTLSLSDALALGESLTDDERVATVERLHRKGVEGRERFIEADPRRERHDAAGGDTDRFRASWGQPRDPLDDARQ
jgi:hypothetical protein